jgi:hypothetical protein
VQQLQAAKKKDDKDRKEGRVDNKNAARYEGILSQFNKEQDYYYQQLEKKEKMRGLDEFKKFSGMTRIDPNYTNNNTGPILPEKPDINKMLEDPAATGGGGGKGGKSTWEKLDPLGSKIIKNDMKNLKKIFA